MSGPRTILAMGGGGVLPEYELVAHTYDYFLRLRPLAGPADDPAELSKQHPA